MRKVLWVPVVLLMLAGCQTVPEGPVPEEYTRTFEFEKFEPEIFDLSMRWLAKAFVSSKSVLQYYDKAEGIIVGNGRIEADITFSLTIEVKQGKARMTFSRFDRDFSSVREVLARAMLEAQGFGPYEYKLLLERMTAMADDYQKYLSSTSTDW